MSTVSLRRQIDSPGAPIASAPRVAASVDRMTVSQHLQEIVRCLQLILLTFIRADVASASVLLVGTRLAALIGLQQMNVAIGAAAGFARINRGASREQSLPLCRAAVVLQGAGTQPVGTRSLAKKITLTNKGSATVDISGIAITGNDAGDFAETNTCGKSVASGASCFIKVTFKPLVRASGQRMFRYTTTAAAARRKWD